MHPWPDRNNFENIPKVRVCYNVPSCTECAHNHIRLAPRPSMHYAALCSIMLPYEALCSIMRIIGLMLWAQCCADQMLAFDLLPAGPLKLPSPEEALAKCLRDDGPCTAAAGRTGREAALARL